MCSLKLFFCRCQKQQQPWSGLWTPSNKGGMVSAGMQEDVSNKSGMLLRLLHVAAHGRTWYVRGLLLLPLFLSWKHLPYTNALIMHGHTRRLKLACFPWPAQCQWSRSRYGLWLGTNNSKQCLVEHIHSRGIRTAHQA